MHDLQRSASANTAVTTSPLMLLVLPMTSNRQLICVTHGVRSPTDFLPDVTIRLSRHFAKKYSQYTVVVVVVVMLVLNACPKDLVVQLTIHPIVLKTILI